MQENMALIKEINDLRNELRDMKAADAGQEHAPGLPTQQQMQGQDDSDDEAKRSLQEGRAELMALKARIAELEGAFSAGKRPASEKLPPMDGVSPREP